jgi:hypothetical protein
MQITANLPGGTSLYAYNGAQLTPSNGVYTLQPEDVLALSIMPPMYWSSPVQGDIFLNTTTIVADTGAGETVYSYTTLDIAIGIKGVANKPNSRNIVVTAPEDSLFDIGSAIGSLDGILVDVS